MRDGSRGWWCGVLALGVVTTAQALAPPEAPTLVKDLFLPTRSASPSGFVTLGNAVYFSAEEETHGRELWKSDGTRSGTVLLKDLCPGSVSCNPREFTRVGNTLFFITGGGDGYRPDLILSPHCLWKTDGTAAGTVRIKELNSGRSDLTPVELTNVGGTLYFGVGQGAYAAQLWKSDGTEEGTEQFMNLLPYQSYAPSSLRAAGDRLFFLTKTFQGKVAWWTSNGMSGGTGQLQEFSPPQYADTTGAPVAVGDLLLLPINYSDGTSQLWRGDGTGTGAGPVGPRFVGRWPETRWVRPFALGRALFFLAQDKEQGLSLWKSDGTDAGTVRVKSLRSAAGVTLEPKWMLGAGNTLYLELLDPRRYTWELWKSDGTEAGTGFLQQTQARPCCDYYDSTFLAVGDVLYVTQPTMLDATHSEELWRIDGTAGAQRIQEFHHAVSDPQLFLGAHLNGRLVFAANDGAHGGEPWVSDGTSAGARLVADLRTSTRDASPTGLTPLGDTLFFSAREDDGPARLWKSDGTEAGTTRVAPSLPEEVREPQQLLKMNGTLYFLAQDARGQQQLWKSDGTREGSKALSHFTEGTLFRLVHTGRALFFVRLDPKGWELWTSEGGEPRLLQLLSPGGSRYTLPTLFAHGETIYAGAPGRPGYDLWKSDGTPGGTVILRNFPSWWESGLPEGFVDLGGTLVFHATENDVRSAWTSDGTAAGTVRLKGTQGTLLQQVGDVVQRQGTPFFMAYAGGKAGLWKIPSPGAAAEPILTTNGSMELVVVNDTLFFTAAGEQYDHELWRSDGTAAGTRRVKDIRPGTAPSSPTELTAAGGWLYLRAQDDVHGQEVWMSDGTEQGTRLLADLSPGLASSHPSNFTLVGTSLYFTATDSPHGNELWRVTVPSGGVSPTDPPPTDPDPTPTDPPPTDPPPTAPPPRDETPVPPAPPVTPPPAPPEAPRGEPPPSEATPGDKAQGTPPVEERLASGCGAAPGIPGVGWGLLLGAGGLWVRRQRFRAGGRP